MVTVAAAADVVASDLEETCFAVLDVETTGFLPRTDRVVEVAVVRVRGDGTVEGQYSTLINPERDVGASHVHGITATDVVEAPRFAEVLGDLAPLLAGAVVVGHNVGFDLRFLEAETTRAGYRLPPMAAVCTLRLSRRLGVPLLRRRLQACCEQAGIELEDAHTALGDASATARLLLHYIGRAVEMGMATLAELGCDREPAESRDWPRVKASGRPLHRDAARRQLDDGAFVRRLLARLEAEPDLDAGVEAYFDVLDRVLEDRRITDDEAEALYEVARIWSLDAGDVRQAHQRYLRTVADAALGDGHLSELERRDLMKVSRLLGIDDATFAAIARDAESACAAAIDKTAATRAGARHQLAGKSICFTGALSGRLDGERITRAVAESLASAAGLEVRDRVSSDLDILVVADPNTQSTKARRARDVGTRILAEAELWRQLGVPAA
jgi:DNA polymerase-3 subunit epsilon